MSWFRNLHLSVKLNLVIVAAVALMLLALFVLLNRTTGALINEVGQIRIDQEIDVIEHDLAEVTRELESAAFLLANTSGFAEAVQANDGARAERLLLTSLASFRVDEFDVINAEGESLLTETASAEGENVLEEDENAVLSQTLFGIERQTITFELSEESPVIEMVLVRPVRDASGTIVGGLLLSRKINDEFLTAINLERQGVELSLIYEGQVVAESFVPGDTGTEEVTNSETIPIQASLVQQALNANTAVNPDIVYSDAGLPYSEAYIPFQGLTDTSPRSVIAIRVENSAISAFQQGLITSLGLVLGILGVSIVVAVLMVVYLTVIKPIGELQKVAVHLSQGDYHHRSKIKGKDEIGQLGQAFNNMAEAVERRNQELSQLNTDLEYQIAQAETARRRAEQSDQVKSAFLASMSHELRTPLNSVINFSKFVVKGVMGPVTERQEETLNKVIGSAKHLLNLINDVLDMSKIESGSLNLFIEDDVDVNEILTSVTNTAESLLEDKPVTLELHNDILPGVRGDRQRILQIMLNIISNACKFTHEGCIRISASTSGSEIVLSVQDTGPGIAPEDQGLVFEPFKQTETGLRQGSGTGLGMPISKKLVEAHGGRLWVESAPGQGATFYIALPIKSEALIPVLA